MKEKKKNELKKTNIAKAVLCETTKYAGSRLFRTCAGKKVLVDLTSTNHFILNGKKKKLFRFTSVKEPWLKPEEVSEDYLFHRDPVLHALISSAS